MIYNWINSLNMNIKKLLKVWKYISLWSVVWVPIIWIILKQFDFLLINFGWFTLYTWLYIVSWYAVVFVMVIRPLADLFRKYKFLRQLCLLRRAFWILSAIIIVTFLFDKWIWNPSSFFAFFTLNNWSWGYPLIARLSEFTALLLILTSNNLSQRKLWKNWKRVQRMSYLYFITGWILAMRYGDDYFILMSMIVVGILFILSWIKKYKKLWIS